MDLSDPLAVQVTKMPTDGVLTYFFVMEHWYMSSSGASGREWTTGPSMFNVFLLEKPHDLSPVGPLLKCVLCEDLPSTLSQIGSVFMHRIQARKEQWLSHSIMYLFCVAVWVLCGVCVCARACVFLCLCTQNTGNTEPLAP